MLLALELVLDNVGRERRETLTNKRTGTSVVSDDGTVA